VRVLAGRRGEPDERVRAAATVIAQLPGQPVRVGALASTRGRAHARGRARAQRARERASEREQLLLVERIGAREAVEVALA
jgi:hypothetical protein